jgi:hypothetical protein
MNPLAAIYHAGGSDPSSYPVSVVHFQTTWSEETGAVTEVVCIATDGSIRIFDAQQVQIVDRAVAEAIVAATAVAEKQRRQFGTVPPMER